MKSFVLLLLFTFSFLNVFSNTSSEYEMMLSDQIKLAQRPGTNRLLSEYMKGASLGKDTVTAFFFIPTACQRCEATIAPSVKCLKSVNPNEQVVLVICHPDSEASSLYVDSLKIGEDSRVFDTEYKFDKIFSTTMGVLQGLFVARIDIKNGRMITGGEHNFVSEDFFREFLAVNTPLPLHVYDEDVVEYRTSSEIEGEASADDNVRYSSYPLDLLNYKPAQIRNHPVVRNGCLVFLDQMCEGGLELKQSEETGNFQLKSLHQIDIAKRDSFISITEDLYEAYKPYFRYMPLDITFMPDGKLAMSYSIPNISLIEENERKFLSFANEIVILQFSEGNSQIESFTTPVNQNLDEWMDQHFRIFPIEKNKIVMTCHKWVWPLSDELRKGDPTSDPFLDAFYEQENPYAVELDLSTGKLTRRFGQLEDVFRQTHTGYWFADLVADTHKGSFIYGNQVVGKLYLTDDKEPEKTLRTYEVFSTGNAPQADSTMLYKQEYMQVFAPYFNHSIEQVTLDDQYINCLVRTGVPGQAGLRSDTYEYVRLSRQTGEVVLHYNLPAELPEERVLAYGLTADDSGNRPFYISKCEGKYFLKFVEKK